jgi:hypothetical protein
MEELMIRNPFSLDRPGPCPSASSEEGFYCTGSHTLRTSPPLNRIFAGIFSSTFLHRTVLLVSSSGNAQMHSISFGSLFYAGANLVVLLCKMCLTSGDLGFFGASYFEDGAHEAGQDISPISGMRYLVPVSDPDCPLFLHRASFPFCRSGGWWQ